MVVAAFGGTDRPYDTAMTDCAIACRNSRTMPVGRRTDGHLDAEPGRPTASAG
jgi:hypothetical protein